MTDYAAAETRAVHVRRAKDLALAHVRRGGLKDALRSMLASLEEHEDTLALAADPMKVAEGYERVMAGDIDGMRAWIERFS